MKLSDIQVQDDPPKTYPDIDLELFLGKKIKRIRCTVSDPFGTVPILHLYGIEFEDGTKVHFEGEHDIVYVSSYRDEEFPMLTEDNLMNVWCAINPDECEDGLEG